MSQPLINVWGSIMGNVQDSLDRMARIVVVVVKGLVDDEDVVSVRITKEDAHTRLCIKVAPPDFGKVVGRGGQNVEALRYLMNAIGNKLGLPTCVDAEGESHVCAHICVDDPRPKKRGRYGGKNMPSWRPRQ